LKSQGGNNQHIYEDRNHEAIGRTGGELFSTSDTREVYSNGHPSIGNGNLFHSGGSGTVMDGKVLNGDNEDQSKLSPDFSLNKLKKVSPLPYHSIGIQANAHAIGLRSSHQSFMSQVDKLESDLLDQSDLDFMANFQKELNDTCKQISTPSTRPTISTNHGNSIIQDRSLNLRQTHPEPFSLPPTFSPISQRNVNYQQAQPPKEEFPTSPSNNSMTPRPLAQPRVPTYESAPQLSQAIRPDLNSLLAPFATIFNGDVPHPQRPPQNGMRDSHYSKDSVSAATVFSTLTRPSFRF
jgi:hypothetical protein